jgi:hypothetical protein
MTREALSELLAAIARRPMLDTGGKGGGIPTDTDIRISRWNSGTTVKVTISFDLQDGPLDKGLNGGGRLKLGWEIDVEVDTIRNWDEESLRQHLLKSVGVGFDEIPARLTEMLAGWSLLRPAWGGKTGGG